MYYIPSLHTQYVYACFAIADIAAEVTYCQDSITTKLIWRACNQHCHGTRHPALCHSAPGHLIQ